MTRASSYNFWTQESRVKKKIEGIKKKAVTKGHERVTFMIIPHGESHIISLQLSKFTIFFGAFITAIVLAASFISMALQEKMEPEVSQLHDSTQTVYYEREEYISKLGEMNRYHNRLKKDILTLFESADMLGADDSIVRDDDFLKAVAAREMVAESAEFDSFMRTLMNESEKKSKSSEEELELLEEFAVAYPIDRFFYSSEVEQFRKLHLDIGQTVTLLALLQNFLQERERVQNSLPYYWPVAGGRFTSFYGPRFSPFGYTSEFHLGVDLADRTGTPIFASADGEVILAGMAGGYGKRVKIKHQFGYSTVYAHMSKMYVKIGQRVVKGQKIGTVGATGRATGPHLHFEVRINDKHVNPLPYLTSL